MLKQKNWKWQFWCSFSVLRINWRENNAKCYQAHILSLVSTRVGLLAQSSQHCKWSWTVQHLRHALSEFYQDIYSRLPTTRTFKGNRKLDFRSLRSMAVLLSRGKSKKVRVIGSSKLILEKRQWDEGAMQISCAHFTSRAERYILLFWKRNWTTKLD